MKNDLAINFNTMLKINSLNKSGIQIIFVYDKEYMKESSYLKEFSKVYEVIDNYYTISSGYMFLQEATKNPLAFASGIMNRYLTDAEKQIVVRIKDAKGEILPIISLVNCIKRKDKNIFNVLSDIRGELLIAKDDNLIFSMEDLGIIDLEELIKDEMSIKIYNLLKENKIMREIEKVEFGYIY